MNILIGVVSLIIAIIFGVISIWLGLKANKLGKLANKLEEKNLDLIYYYEEELPKKIEKNY